MGQRVAGLAIMARRRDAAATILMESTATKRPVPCVVAASGIV
jgi:hypothetical protein